MVAGVVASALLSRPRPSDGGAGVPVAQSPTTAPAPYVPLGKPMPSGCEVDPSNPPVLAFEDVPLNRLALGAMAQGQQLDQTVTVRNTGRGVLCVRDVEYGCGCVKARWDGEARVPPAGSGTIAIHVDTTDLAGPVEKWVTLYTNDPARQPGAVLLVSFDVRLGIILKAAPGLRASHLELRHARAGTSPRRACCASRARRTGPSGRSSASSRPRSPRSVA